MDDPHVQLMLRFQRGDESAYKELYETYKIPILNFSYRFCQDRRVAEELSQEVFLRVYKTASTYRPDAKFSTWLYRIATNICLNEMRTGKYRYELEQHHAGGEEALSTENKNSEFHRNVHERIIADEAEQSVRKAMASLPGKQRAALLFSVYEELSYREIGQRLGCSEGAVKSIIHRAKIGIRDILKRGIPRDNE